MDRPVSVTTDAGSKRADQPLLEGTTGFRNPNKIWPEAKRNESVERNEGSGSDQMKNKTALDFLEEMATTYRERNEIYKDNYKQIGKICQLLFPNGVDLKTSKDFNRYFCLVMVIGKLTRYTYNFEKGGHADSIHDLAVYSAMLMELDSE